MAYKNSRDIADKVCAARNAAAREGVYFEVARANAEGTLFYVSEYERDHMGVAQFKGQVFVSEETLAEIANAEKAALAREYVATIGYDPFEDDPTISADEVAQTLAEYHAAAKEESGE